MENKEVFTTDNINELKSICEKIISLCNEHNEGSLMLTQLICLGDNIRDFSETPIVENSGIIHNTPDIRNKLTPISNLIAMLEDGVYEKVELKDIVFSEIEQCKNSIKYLSK